MPTGSPGPALDALLFVVTVFAVMAVSRLFALVIPTEFYFTFQSLFSDRPAQAMVVALLGKMLAPLLVGLAAGWWLFGAARRNAGGLARRLRGRWSPALFLGGFFAAFLSAWPMVVHWDLLANPEVLHLKPIFLVLYLLYMFGYGYVTLLGLLGAIYVREHVGPERPETRLVSLAELSRVGALWLLNSGIASAALEVVTS